MKPYKQRYLKKITGFSLNLLKDNPTPVSFMSSKYSCGRAVTHLGRRQSMRQVEQIIVNGEYIK